tara:strand:- start:5618 stop:6622 length:1005 start_codon:yes stop_codon:yes gene_type:complete
MLMLVSCGPSTKELEVGLRQLGTNIGMHFSDGSTSTFPANLDEAFLNDWREYTAQTCGEDFSSKVVLNFKSGDSYDGSSESVLATYTDTDTIITLYGNGLTKTTTNVQPKATKTTTNVQAETTSPPSLTNAELAKKLSEVPPKTPEPTPTVVTTPASPEVSAANLEKLKRLNEPFITAVKDSTISYEYDTKIGLCFKVFERYNKVKWNKVTKPNGAVYVWAECFINPSKPYTHREDGKLDVKHTKHTWLFKVNNDYYVEFQNLSYDAVLTAPDLYAEQGFSKEISKDLPNLSMAALKQISKETGIEINEKGELLIDNLLLNESKTAFIIKDIFN